MTETEKLKKRFEGWFATSFWVDLHYATALAATLVVIAKYALHNAFDVGFSTFAGTLWVSALGNDKVNMPASPGN